MIRILKNALGLFLQFAVIALILAFILVGLWQIGLIEMPPFIDALFHPENKKPSQNEGFENMLSELLKEDGTREEYTVLKAEMTPESVRQMLATLSPQKTYVQDIEYTLYSGDSSVTERIVVLSDDTFRAAYYVAHTTGAYKQILEHDGTTWISVLQNGRIKTVTYPTGSNDIAAETGVILTHRDFLDTSPEETYTYSLVSSEEGTLMLITFTSTLGSYSQSQTYMLNLDYGVVTEAHCYENDTLIYSLTTSELSENGTINFHIPSGFTELLPADAGISVRSNTESDLDE